MQTTVDQNLITSRAKIKHINSRKLMSFHCVAKMSPLLISIFLLVLCDEVNSAAYSTVPNFQASDADIEKLIGLMYDDDKEKPDYCDIHLDYQGSK